MNRIALAIATSALLAAAPLVAQEAEEAPDVGFSLMEEGARLFLRGLMSELEPTLDEMQDLAQEMEPALRSFAEEMGPAMAKLMSLIDEIGNYEPPEVLPNGDIIIRRREDAPPYVAPEGEVEL